MMTYKSLPGIRLGAVPYTRPVACCLHLLGVMHRICMAAEHTTHQEESPSPSPSLPPLCEVPRMKSPRGQLVVSWLPGNRYLVVLLGTKPLCSTAHLYLGALL